MTPKKYIQKLEEMQGILVTANKELNIAINKIHLSLESGDDSLVEESQLTALHARDTVHQVTDHLLLLGVSKIEK